MTLKPKQNHLQIILKRQKELEYYLTLEFLTAPLLKAMTSTDLMWCSHSSGNCFSNSLDMEGMIAKLNDLLLTVSNHGCITFEFACGIFLKQP